MHHTSQKTPIVLFAMYVVAEFLLLEMRWLLNRLLGPEPVSDSVPKQVF